MLASYLAAGAGKLFTELGYKFFEQGDLNLNLVGLRGSRTHAGEFDDAMLCLYRAAGRWRVHVWPVTTDPSPRYLRSPINAKGCAVLVPGQYSGAYEIGLHFGRPALVQRKPVRVWRDANHDAVVDWQEDEEGASGYYGINIHDTTHKGVGIRGDVSAGCQVFALRREHSALMALAKAAQGTWGPRFTYTLLSPSQGQRLRRYGGA